MFEAKLLEILERLLSFGELWRELPEGKQPFVVNVHLLHDVLGRDRAEEELKECLQTKLAAIVPRLKRSLLQQLPFHEIPCQLC